MNKRGFLLTAFFLGLGAGTVVAGESSTNDAGHNADAKTAASAAAKVTAAQAARMALGMGVGAIGAGATVTFTPTRIGCDPKFEKCAH